MKKRRRKKIRYDRLILLLLALILVLSLIVLLLMQFINIFKNPYYDLGYSAKATSVFKQLDDNYQKNILNNQYNENLERLVVNDDFILKNYEQYLKIINENTDYNLADVFKSVELNLDYQRYLILKNNIFSKDKYYILDNYDRYLSYFENNYNYENEKVIRDVVETVNCNADYDAYDRVFDTDISLNHLMLVNKYYRLSKDYQPKDLVKIDDSYAYNGYLVLEAKKNFDLMVKDAEKQGYFLYANSTYRDYDEQLNLFNEYTLSSGQIAADSFSARAGHSEHQSGYVVDFISNDSNSVLESFEFTKEYKWMQENAYKYGFIQRYKKGKEKYTGYIAEAWHYRYVGVDIATYLQHNDITFDEYYEFYIKRGSNE